MHKVVTDFEFTVLWPCIVFAIAVLLASILTYLQPSEERQYWRPSEERGHYEFAENDAQRKVNDARWHLRDAEWELREFEWKYLRSQERRKAKDFIWVSAITLVLLCVVMLIGDKWKADISELAWKALMYVSALSFFITIPVAWSYARQLKWLRLGACLLVLLVSAAGCEHCLHQSMNAHHATCPHCSDDDDEPDDN